MRRPLSLSAFVIALAGCLNVPEPSSVVDAPPAFEETLPEFTLPKLIDPIRAGGEPVIAITPKGTILVGAHPGTTHTHPDAQAPGEVADLVVPTTGQNFLWRSADGGAHWQHIGLLPVDAPNNGPRGPSLGIGDPDLAVAANGRAYFTELFALATVGVLYSDDDGATWLRGNPASFLGPVDRQWLGVTGDAVYLHARTGTGGVRRSTDGGLTWDIRGEPACGGDIVAHPANGKVYVGCEDGFTMSVDEGRTWVRKRDPQGGSLDLIETEPAIDAAGRVYMAGVRNGSAILSWTPDDGTTWGRIDVGPEFPELAGGTVIWPWASAGSAGRASLTFFGSPTADAIGNDAAEWFVYTAIVIGTDSPAPRVFAQKLTPEPFHVGAICHSGTTCAATTLVRETSDRRLGDFFETAVDRDGFLHVVYADTTHAPQDAVGHVGYVRQTAGPRLVEGPVGPGFPLAG